MKKIQFYTILTVFTCLGLTNNISELTEVVNDLILHFAGYVVLIISALLAYDKHHVHMFILLFIYSAMIEIIQYFLPYRTFSELDILANLSGLIIGSILWIGFKQFHKNKDMSSPTNSTFIDD